MPIIANQFGRVAASTTNDIVRRDQVEEFGFQNMSEGRLDWLNPIDRTTMQDDAVRLWLNNPMGHRFIEAQNNYVVGDGLHYTAVDEDTEKVMDNYYKHPQNAWDLKFTDRVRTMSVLGEMLLPISITEGTGKAIASNISPTKIVSRTVEKGNDEDVVAVTTKDNDVTTKYDMIRWVEDVEGDNYFGDAFFWRLNNLSFSSHGYSDLYFYRDWLAMYEKSLFTTAKRTGLLMSFLWDVTVKGGSPEQLQAKRAALYRDPPKPGSWRIHNDEEEWKEITPNLQGREYREVYDLLKTQLYAGGGMPEYFYGTAENTNLAAARVMGKPFYRQIRERQGFIINMFNQQFRYAIWNAKQKGTLNSDADENFTLWLREPDDDKVDAFAASFKLLADSVIALDSNSYITETETQSIIDMLFDQLGLRKDESQDDSNTGTEKDGAAERMATAAGYLTYMRKKIEKQKKPA